MKDTTTRRIFEKENQAEVSNNIEKRNNQKSLTQLVSLTLLNHQPNFEFKSIDVKQQYSQQNYLTQRNPNVQSLHYRPEQKQKTTICTTIQIYSPIKVRQTTQISQSIHDHSTKEPKNQQNRFLYNYGDIILTNYQIYDGIQKFEFLKKHSINSSLRAKMIDWMIEVLTSYKCKDQTFFLAVRLMDQYLNLSLKSHAPQDMHLIGVTCMFIACKFEEVQPVKLQTVHEKIAHKKLSKEEIREKENQIGQALDFKFFGATLYEIITITLQMINQYQKLHQIVVYLAKMIIYDYSIISQFNYSLLSAACIIIGCNLSCQDQSDEIIAQVLQLLNVDKDATLDLSSRILNLAKNFDKQFQNLENLKKFNKNSILDIVKLQK
ncbi:unnamed protein product (macronuclear) [Paramecium tetraurelia]|uniref:Cyclin-like domain-containing protein n=1 Tax=Paramecium tetraurelia TaxID=5888 RepID=A0CXJ3_PARTE|nr:uncharacterized protein GSPATT00011142001 [Paramecium tetraurelia]CAK75510.1 unnamed protein product [Paramecium tetraurelia]|eukprot:XP_001442907.1 hypothetical protein (macronuclear) [Paramecium tetraurelia strain d4-2]